MAVEISALSSSICAACTSCEPQVSALADASSPSPLLGTYAWSSSPFTPGGTSTKGRQTLKALAPPALQVVGRGLAVVLTLWHEGSQVEVINELRDAVRIFITTCRGRVVWALVSPRSWAGASLWGGVHWQGALAGCTGCSRVGLQKGREF